MLPVILAGVFVFMSIQTFFAYYQIKNVYKAIDEIRKDNKGKEGTLAMGTAKSIYSMKKGVVDVVVISEDNQVIDYWDMKGRTVLCKLKRVEDYVGLTVDECLSSMQTKKEKQAFKAALKQIEEIRKANETVAQLA